MRFCCMHLLSLIAPAAIRRCNRCSRAYASRAQALPAPDSPIAGIDLSPLWAVIAIQAILLLLPSAI